MVSHESVKYIDQITVDGWYVLLLKNQIQTIFRGFFEDFFFIIKTILAVKAMIKT